MRFNGTVAKKSSRYYSRYCARRRKHAKHYLKQPLWLGAKFYYAVVLLLHVGVGFSLQGFKQRIKNSSAVAGYSTKKGIKLWFMLYLYGRSICKCNLLLGIKT